MYRLILIPVGLLFMIGPFNKNNTEQIKASTLGNVVPTNWNSNTGNDLQDGIDIGDQAPNFSAKTPQGKELSLEDVLDKKGKYTLVEFWASWCPFCQREMPNVVEVYKKYHDKGLNILSVSIDDNKDEWINDGIRKFGMNWNHVSNLRKWNDPIVKKYGVHSIPSNFLLDQNGKVIAKDKKGDELKREMKKLLGDN